jgi:hypothetical protein
VPATLLGRGAVDHRAAKGVRPLEMLPRATAQDCIYYYRHGCVLRSRRAFHLNAVGNCGANLRRLREPRRESRAILSTRLTALAPKGVSGVIVARPDRIVVSAHELCRSDRRVADQRVLDCGLGWLHTRAGRIILSDASWSIATSGDHE